MNIKDYFYDPKRPTFFRFGRIMDAYVSSVAGIGLLDLADQDYSSLHEEWDGSHEDAERIAREILASEGLVL